MDPSTLELLMRKYGSNISLGELMQKVKQQSLSTNNFNITNSERRSESSNRTSKSKSASPGKALVSKSQQGPSSSVQFGKVGSCSHLGYATSPKSQSVETSGSSAHDQPSKSLNLESFSPFRMVSESSTQVTSQATVKCQPTNSPSKKSGSPSDKASEGQAQLALTPQSTASDGSIEIPVNSICPDNTQQNVCDGSQKRKSKKRKSSTSESPSKRSKLSFPPPLESLSPLPSADSVIANSQVIHDVCTVPKEYWKCSVALQRLTEEEICKFSPRRGERQEAGSPSGIPIHCKIVKSQKTGFLKPMPKSCQKNVLLKQEKKTALSKKRTRSPKAKEGSRHSLEPLKVNIPTTSKIDEVHFAIPLIPHKSRTKKKPLENKSKGEVSPLVEHEKPSKPKNPPQDLPEKPLSTFDSFNNYHTPAEQVNPLEKLSHENEELDFEPDTADDDDAISIFADPNMFRNEIESLRQKNFDNESEASYGSNESRKLSDMDISSEDSEEEKTPDEALSACGKHAEGFPVEEYTADQSLSCNQSKDRDVQVSSNLELVPKPDAVGSDRIQSASGLSVNSSHSNRKLCIGDERLSESLPTDALNSNEQTLPQDCVPKTSESSEVSLNENPNEVVGHTGTRNTLVVEVVKISESHQQQREREIERRKRSHNLSPSLSQVIFPPPRRVHRNEQENCGLKSPHLVERDEENETLPVTEGKDERVARGHIPEGNANPSHVKRMGLLPTPWIAPSLNFDNNRVVKPVAIEKIPLLPTPTPSSNIVGATSSRTPPSVLPKTTTSVQKANQHTSRVPQCTSHQLTSEDTHNLLMSGTALVENAPFNICGREYHSELEPYHPLPMRNKPPSYQGNSFHRDVDLRQKELNLRPNCDKTHYLSQIQVKSNIVHELSSCCPIYLTEGKCNNPSTCQLRHSFPIVKCQEFEETPPIITALEDMVMKYEFWMKHQFSVWVKELGNVNEMSVLLALCQILWKRDCFLQSHKLLAEKRKLKYFAHHWEHIADAISRCSVSPAGALKQILSKVTGFATATWHGDVLDNILFALYTKYIEGEEKLWPALESLTKLRLGDDERYEIPAEILKEILRDAVGESRAIDEHAAICDYLLKSAKQRSEEKGILSLIHNFIHLLKHNAANVNRGMALANYYSMHIDVNCCKTNSDQKNTPVHSPNVRFCLQKKSIVFEKTTTKNLQGESEGVSKEYKMKAKQSVKPKVIKKRKAKVIQTSSVSCPDSTSHEEEVTSSTGEGKIGFAVGSKRPSSIPGADNTGCAIINNTQRLAEVVKETNWNSSQNMRSTATRAAVKKISTPAGSERASSLRKDQGIQQLIDSKKFAIAASKLILWRTSDETSRGVKLVVESLSKLSDELRNLNFKYLLNGVCGYTLGKASDYIMKSTICRIGLIILADLVGKGCWTLAAELLELILSKLEPESLETDPFSPAFVALMTARIYLQNNKIKESLKIIKEKNFSSAPNKWACLGEKSDVLMRDEICDSLLEKCISLVSFLAHAEWLFEQILDAKDSYSYDVGIRHYDKLLLTLAAAGKNYNWGQLLVRVFNNHQLTPQQGVTNRLLLDYYNRLQEEDRMAFDAVAVHIIMQNPYDGALPQSVMRLKPIVVSLQSVWLVHEVRFIFHYLLDFHLCNLPHGEDMPDIAIGIKESQLPDPTPESLIVDTSVAAMEGRVVEALKQIGLNSPGGSYKNGSLRLDSESVSKYIENRRNSLGSRNFSNRYMHQRSSFSEDGFSRDTTVPKSSDFNNSQMMYNRRNDPPMRSSDPGTYVPSSTFQGSNPRQYPNSTSQHLPGVPPLMNQGPSSIGSWNNISAEEGFPMHQESLGGGPVNGMPRTRDGYRGRGPEPIMYGNQKHTALKKDMPYQPTFDPYRGFPQGPSVYNPRNPWKQRGPRGGRGSYNRGYRGKRYNQP